MLQPSALKDCADDVPRHDSRANAAITESMTRAHPLSIATTNASSPSEYKEEVAMYMSILSLEDLDVRLQRL